MKKTHGLAGRPSNRARKPPSSTRSLRLPAILWALIDNAATKEGISSNLFAHNVISDAPQIKNITNNNSAYMKEVVEVQKGEVKMVLCHKHYNAISRSGDHAKIKTVIGVCQECLKDWQATLKI